MALEHHLDTELAKAVRIAGSQSAFGRLVGKRQSTIREWLLSDKVSPESVLKVEEVTGISRHHLRPDVYGPEPTEDPPHPFPDAPLRTVDPAPGAIATLTKSKEVGDSVSADALSPERGIA